MAGAIDDSTINIVVVIIIIIIIIITWTARPFAGGFVMSWLEPFPVSRLGALTFTHCYPI